MNKHDIQLLYKYNQWANARILNAVAQVSAEEFLAPASYPHGGLRGTLVHALFAEWIWRNRWEGNSPTHRLKPEDFPTFQSLQERWAEVRKRAPGAPNLRQAIEGRIDAPIRTEDVPVLTDDYAPTDALLLLFQ